MEHVRVCLDLGRLVERSNGIFGRSGTGKSFLARLVLCGLVKTQACVNLVFDMHTEYAYSKEKETGGFVKGLRELFGMGRVRVYSLDEQATRRTRGRVDGLIRIPIEYIEVNDLMTLQQELDLSETAPYTASVLRGALGPGWLAQLIAISPKDLKELCENTGVHQGSVEALKRRVETFKDLDFIVRDGKGLGTGIDELLADLKAGHNVILEFGRYNTVLAYMLVANIITKRIHKEWVAATERYDDTQNAADKPRPLMITIEEAHKFLSQKSTIFSIIAREMRKYSVTLLVIDQRPSSIDAEVLSQLGTRITALLSDERDIDAVFTGTRAGHMRQTLATLDTRQEVLIFGHAVPMEVVLRTREFDDAFYRSLGKDAALSRQERAAKAAADLFGEG
jgi:DNA helicase HerA-like ATPase